MSSRASVGAVWACAFVLAAMSLAVFAYGIFVTLRPSPSDPLASSRHSDPVESAIIVAAFVLGLSALGLFKRSNVARLLVVVLLSVAATMSAFWLALTLFVALSGWGPRAALLSQLSAALGLYLGVFLVAGSGALFLSSRGVRQHFSRPNHSA